MVVLNEETLGGNAFLAIESTPGDEEEVNTVHFAYWNPFDHKVIQPKKHLKELNKRERERII